MKSSCARGSAAAGVAAVLLALSVRARSDAASDAKKWIQAAYNRENAAAIRRDVDGVLADTAPDYVSVSPRGGSTPLRLIKPRLRPLLEAMRVKRATTRVTKVVLKGPEAHVATTEHVVAVLANPETQRPANLVIDSTTESVWVRGGKGWLKKRSRSHDVRRSMDGKPLPPR